MRTERRRHPRRAVRLLVKHKPAGSNKTVIEYATNISEGGIFLETKRRSTLGESFEVEFVPEKAPKDAEPIRALCEVCRVAPAGVGARFVRLDTDSALLLNLLASR